ncbi:DUF2314 domain-containing protein [Gemmata sp. JC673]|uniref:DUF2314 domain-containing protein n=1 Tax=Gemmata algarum TaxID=2975278 RepID=A0ABU5F7Q8_9BACT|nr:DUF2314 domain-containing protein [Gemmata algarum]MDY3563572.1 DUF2314 domain-containing protein [Gemmata algarum]
MADADKPTTYTPNILWLDGSDPEMATAVSVAQRAFDQYREALERAARAVEDCGVKVFFPSRHAPTTGEHMWVNEVTFGPDGMTGTLCNDPGWLRGLACGDRVPFTIDRVSDWFYVSGGVLHGGFTLKVLFRQYTPEQFAECRSDPPACYLADWYDQQRADRSA